MMPDAMAAIEVRRLSKTLGRRTVLSGVDFQIAAGQSVALTGANGAGKTTLLRCLASILRPTAGLVRWFGRPAAGNPEARRLVGWVAHESLLYPQLTLRENLAFAARMCDVAQPWQRADELLAGTGLAPYAARLPAAISRGMRQRLAVLRALVHRPRILLLDEPFSGLDAEGTAWLGQLLGELRAAGRTLCFATHDEAVVCRLADRVLEVRRGRVEEIEPGAADAAPGTWPAARAA
jgi:heme ABC exporter ATP-binding subunit CcmA